MPKGYFISFEGGDGLGKSTQIALLARALRKRGRQVLVTREPGGTRVGELLRKILKEEDMSPLAEAFVLEASRVEHVRKVIRPALKRGFVVITDRYQESTLVYQGYVQGEDIGILKKLNKIATDGLNPQSIILLDGSRRRLSGRSRKDKFDQKTHQFHERVRKGFKKLSRSSSNWLSIDASQSIEEVHQSVLKALAQRLPGLRL